MSDLYNDQRYSKELKYIVYKMIQIDPEQRPDSCAIYKLFQTYYIKYYVKSTGIYSAIRCLFNFQNLLDHLFLLNIQFIKTKLRYILFSP